MNGVCQGSTLPVESENRRKNRKRNSDLGFVKEACFLLGAKIVEPTPGEGGWKSRRLVQKGSARHRELRQLKGQEACSEEQREARRQPVQSGPGKHAPEVKATEKRGFRAERGKFLRTLAIWRG